MDKLMKNSREEGDPISDLLGGGKLPRNLLQECMQHISGKALLEV